MIQETWSREPITLEGYCSFEIEAEALKIFGRAKGGLGILISTNLASASMPLPPLKTFAMAILLHLSEESLIIINVYMPSMSKKAEIQTSWGELERYISDLILQHPHAMMILGGDLNARMGPNDRSLYARFGLVPPEREVEPRLVSRSSKDHTSNLAGLCLAQMAYKLNLHILNGALREDNPAEFTFLSGIRMSAIDYMLVSEDLLPHVENIKVIPRSESDHFPVSLGLIDICNRKDYREFDRQAGDNSVADTHCRVKWTAQLNQKLTKLLSTGNLQSIREALLSAKTPEATLRAYNDLTKALYYTLGKNNQKQKKTHKTQYHSKEWFDTDCIIAKKTLQSSYQEFVLCSNQSTAQQLLQQKRHYKHLLILKKKEAIKNNWKQVIKAAKSNNPTLFWNILGRSLSNRSSTADSPIPAKAWEIYFHNLYKTTDDRGHTFQDLQNLPNWSPVTRSEIETLITKLKHGKAPGVDLIPPEAIKNNLNFWVPVLASLFSTIDAHGCIPNDWGLSVIIPIYKKGKKDDPANYRPISLLSTISKLYARHLQWKLRDWMEQENIIAEEQAGFREGRSTIDQASILQHLIEKYASNGTASLYVAFIDFRAAFDSIPRSKLWEKLEESTIDKRLLYLIRALHQGTSSKVRCPPHGQLTKAIPIGKGVRQGCILAPLLFNFYVNDMPHYLSNLDFHPPKLAGKHVSVLLYADDAAIISRTPIGLRRALKTLAAYCRDNLLELNLQKTKVMAFAKRPKPHTWYIEGHKIEQVNSFKYLGVVFTPSGNRKAHGDNVAAIAQRSANGILKFLRTKGRHFIPAALKLFETKVIAQLLYGAQLGLPANITTMERVQSKFLRSALQQSKFVSNAVIRLETGFVRIQARVWRLMLNYWLKLAFSQDGLAPLIIQDECQTKWKREVEFIMTNWGFSRQFLLSVGFDQAKKIIKQRSEDTERQADLNRAPQFIASESIRHRVCQMPYLSTLEIPKHRRAFTLARCQALPSAILEGRYKKIPLEERRCPCGLGQLETTEHILLFCLYYRDLRSSFIRPILRNFPGRTEQFYISLLLQDSTPEITYAVARFCAASSAMRRRILALYS